MCRKYDLSEASCYPWRSKFGGMSVPDTRHEGRHQFPSLLHARAEIER